jgi:hypothetical protein
MILISNRDLITDSCLRNRESHTKFMHLVQNIKNISFLGWAMPTLLFWEIFYDFIRFLSKSGSHQ